MPLTVPSIKAAKPKEQDYKIFDEKGLFLLVKSNGSKYWRLKFRVAGREKLLALGVFPDTTLEMARRKRDEARRQLADGIDPAAAKKAKKLAERDAAGNSFQVIALEWRAKNSPKWSESHRQRVGWILENRLFPWLGTRPIKEITPHELLEVIRKPESEGKLETAKRAKQVAGQVFRYGVATARCDRDPSSDLRGALASPQKVHYAAITEPKAVGELLRAIDNFNGTPVVKAALQLSPLLFCRPGELRHAEWSEINWEASRWEIPAEKMKMREPHIVPLSSQAIAILRELQPITKRSKFVFPSARGASRPLSENGVRVALRTMGFTNQQMTPHGFRAMARTILDEELNFRVELIEHQLAHAVRDANGRAYNRTKFLEQRAEMMQRWADYLDELRVGGNVIAANFNRASV